MDIWMVSLSHTRQTHTATTQWQSTRYAIPCQTIPYAHTINFSWILHNTARFTNRSGFFHPHIHRNITQSTYTHAHIFTNSQTSSYDQRIDSFIIITSSTSSSSSSSSSFRQMNTRALSKRHRCCCCCCYCYVVDVRLHGMAWHEASTTLITCWRSANQFMLLSTPDKTDFDRTSTIPVCCVCCSKFTPAKR